MKWTLQGKDDTWWRWSYIYPFVPSYVIYLFILFLAGDFSLLLCFGGIDFSSDMPEYTLSALVLLIVSTILLLRMDTLEWDNSKPGKIYNIKSATHDIGIIPYSLDHSSIKNKIYGSRSTNKIKYSNAMDRINESIEIISPKFNMKVSQVFVILYKWNNSLIP